LYRVIVVNHSNRFFSGRIGQSEAIRVDYNQCGHLSYKKFFKIFAFFFETKSELILSCSSRLFRKRGGWGRRAGVASPAEAGRANTLTIFFEMRSNFSKNEHQKGNRIGSGGSAGCARPRRQRCKGKIQVRREPP